MYSIGFDYGTESCRAVLLNLHSGECECVEEQAYENGVITDTLNGIKLNPLMVLQNPNDYLRCMKQLTAKIIANNHLKSIEIKAIGIDFTSCTVLPVGENFEPLCTEPRYCNEPHAYAKLWKSHSANEEAKYITKHLNESALIKKYGGIISSEWLFPKLLEIKNNAPKIFHEMTYFLEAGDWLVCKLTNNLIRSSCQAGFKGMWQKERLQEDEVLLQTIDKDFANLFQTKLAGDIKKPGEYAGNLTNEMAQYLNLHTEVKVAVAIIDAHAAVVGAGLSKSSELLISVGTSSCHILLAQQEKMIPGVAGVVEDGIFENLYAYEAGQVAVGDIFSSFVKEQIPSKYFEEAHNRNKSIFDYLNERAAHLQVGESGLVILDWHNGNRTPFATPDVSAVIIGETLKTKAYEKYRALIESTAFGTKLILQLFEKNHLPIEKIVLAGGIPRKNQFLVQIYADVLQKEIVVLQEQQVTAIGAAILGAATLSNMTVRQTAEKYGCKKIKIVKPNDLNKEAYEKLYSMYMQLLNMSFNSGLLQQLHQIKNEINLFNTN
jgi:L-ribulokinase